VYTQRSAGEIGSRFSRLPKVIKSDTNRSGTYDFLLVIHSNRGLSRAVSEINGDFDLKTHIFVVPPYV